MNRIQWRIFFPYLLLLLGTIVSVSGYLIYSLRQSYIENLETGLITNGKILASEIANLFEDPSGLDQFDELAKKWAALSGYRITIIADDGTVMGESHENRFEMDNHANRPEIVEAVQTGQGSSIRYSDTVGYQLLYTAVPIIINGRIVGYLRISVPLQTIQANIQSTIQILISITILAAFIAMFLAWWIAGRTTQPIRKLTQTALDISRKARMGERIATPIEAPTLDEIGDLTHAFNTMTAQLQDELDQIEAERMKMAIVLDEMTDGVLIVDDKGLIQMINPAAKGMFDTLPDNPIGLSLVEVVRNHQIVDFWQKSRSTKKTVSGSVELGSNRLFLQVVVTPSEQLLPGNSLILLQNLTQIKRLETIRRDFISNISHELRTPLASLKALTETLQESAIDDPPAAHRFLQRMETEVDALSLMVSELLELARIESGRVPLNMKAARPIDIISNAVDRLYLQAERSGLVLITVCPEDLPLIYADSNRMEQVLVNLLHNAIKFTTSGGEIKISAEEKGDYIQFSVQDTGIGIPKSELSRIFERFYKTDPARTGSGTGLGLAISRHLVEAHHGRIWADSVEGSGSKFYFTIPKTL